ncbi:MAG: haloacid dehalogenase type II [Myxococcota bacterium]
MGKGVGSGGSWSDDPGMRGYIRAAVFDAYGTLFDVHSAAAQHAEELGPDRERISQLWRQKQLEYTWLRSLMQRYSNFWNVTEEALDYALAAAGREDPSLRSKLLDVYRRLETYPEVKGTLQALRDGGLHTAILSNGSPSMLDDAVRSAGLDGLLDEVLSVDDIGLFKPDPNVYLLAEEALDLPRERIAFMTSNAWDAAGAAAYGFRVVWINRFEQPPENLPAGPEVELSSLSELPAVLTRP